jgi:N-acetylglucosaminyl-diphospho-decaprenol L-rhamnosyltransferase
MEKGLSKQPKISILVVMYNNEESVDKCLESIQNQTYKNIETIVLDNASSDKSIETAKNEKYKDLDIKFVERNVNNGFAGGCDDAYDVSTGDIVLLLNPDAWMDPDTIEKVVEVFGNHKDVGIIQNKILIAEDLDKLDSAGSFITKTGFLKHVGYIDAKTHGNEEKYVFAGKGASLFIKREVIQNTFLFNRIFFLYFEDTDVCWRSWLMGKKVLYTPQGVTYHTGGVSAFKMRSGFTDFHSFKNRIYSLITNLEMKNLLYILPFHLILCMVISMTYILRGRFGNGLSIFKAILWNIRNLSETLKTRKLIQKQRTLSDKYIFGIVGEKVKFWDTFIKYGLGALLGYTGKLKKDPVKK